MAPMTYLLHLRNMLFSWEMKYQKYFPAGHPRKKKSKILPQRHHTIFQIHIVNIWIIKIDTMISCKNLVHNNVGPSIYAISFLEKLVLVR